MVLFLRPKRKCRLTLLTSFVESLLRTISPLRHFLIPRSGWFSASACSGMANGGKFNMVRFNILAAIGSALLVVGCNPTPVTITPPRIAQGGRSLSIAVVSNNPQRLVVATETGGLFRTYDGGNSWQHLDGLPNYQVIDVAIPYLAPDTIIATTQPQYATVNDGGIWRSTDAGGTWYQATNWAPPYSSTCPDRPGAFGISHMPLTHTFYVGTDCGLVVSNDDGATWSIVPGINTRIRSVLVINNTSGVAAGDSGLWFLDNKGVWQQSPNLGTPGVPVTHSFASPWFSGAGIFFMAAGNQTLWLSTNGGATWAAQSAPSNPMREAFVRIGRSLQGDDSKFELYWGDGTFVHRKTFSVAGPTGASDWVDLKSDHSDPSDIALDNEFRVPILLATDGGVHRTTDQGATWTLTGGGYGGFDALQIAEIKGAVGSGTPPQQFLYFGTQDNDLKASTDGGGSWTAICCEGRFITATSTRVTGSACGPCGNFVSGPGFQNQGTWRNAPDGGSVAAGDDAPALLGGDSYLQDFANTSSPPNFDFWVTTNAGTSWFKGFNLQFTPIGATLVPGPAGNPVIYQGYQEGGELPFGGPRFGLVRATNLFAGGSTTPADGSGSVAFGSLHTPIARYMVVGADPNNPNHLIAADAENNEMKFSADGGANWFSLPQLTSAVTSNGQYLFELQELTLASVVAFDPANSCHILVGTLQNGIMRSTDGGNTWQRIDGSTLVANVSSFYFPPTGWVWVSTDGRGLWTLSLGRNGTKGNCSFPSPPGNGNLDNTILAIDAATGANHELKGLDDPALCSGCTVIVVRNGWVTDVQRSDDTLRGFAVSGGTVYQLNRAGKEVPLTVPNTYQPGDGKLRRIIPPNAPTGTRRIRGLVLEGNRLRYVIASRVDLPFAPQRTPKLYLFSASQPGRSSVGPGEEVRVMGVNFLPTSRSAGPVQISFDGQVVAKQVRVGANGSFSVDLPVQHLPGELQATAEQQDAHRLTVTKALIDVIAQDSGR